VAGLEGDDPLVLELKLYDGVDYGVAYVGQGVTQAYRYAEDYGKSVAHLVIANLSDEVLDLPSDGGEGDWPPRLQVGNVTIYLVVVQVRPLKSASKQGKAQVKTVARKDLLNDLALDNR
jgi:microcompartment protein CcmL/EutN